MRKLGIVSAVCALGLTALGVRLAQGQGMFGMTLDYASPQANLFFIDPGFMDVASANGIAGAVVNPAALGSVQTAEIGIAGGLSRSIRFPFELDLVEEGESEELPEGLSIPFTLQFEERGGIDYFGGAYRLGPVVLGGTIIRGESYGLTPALNGEIEQDFSLIFEDTLTHEDHPDIPESDTIPVTWSIQGTGRFDFLSSGDGRASITPMFVGAGAELGPVKMGMGVNLVRYRGDADVLLTASGGGEALLGSLDTTVSGWDIDLNVNGVVESDTILVNNFQGNMSGNQVALVFGLQGKLAFVDFGMGVERGFPFELRGEYENAVRYATAIPETIEVDTSGVRVDSIGRRIWGEAVVRVSDLELDERIDRDQGRFRFGSRIGGRFGLGVNIFALRLGAAGGFDFFEPGQSSVGVYHLSGVGGFSVGNVSLRASLLSRWQFLQFEEILVPFPPHLSMGVATSVNVSPITFDLALRMNLLPAMLEAMESLESERSIRPFSSLNLGVGVRCSL